MKENANKKKKNTAWRGVVKDDEVDSIECGAVSVGCSSSGTTVYFGSLSATE